MVACRRSQQLRLYGLSIICFLIMLPSCGRDISQKLRVMKILQVQEERRKLAREICDADNVTFQIAYMKDKKRYHHLLVDDEHALIYCYVPKVACTNLKRIMLVLKNGEPYNDPSNITGNVHNKLPRLSSFPKSHIEAKLKHYTKFLFVRNPFVRLISAYRDKLEQLDEHFYKYYGRDIFRVFTKYSKPPKTLKEALASGMQISFHDFAKYLLDPRTERLTPFEPHWRQMYRLCHPCQIQYDFIGHQETLQEDAEHLLRILKLQDDIKIPPSYENLTSTNSVINLFKTLTPEVRKKLFNLYEKDFQLFGYRKPDELFQE